MINRGANSDSIPLDLIHEILSRLPAKSVARFRCVSKPWNSIICRQDFTESFRSMSSSNPRLLIGVAQGYELSFFSFLRPHGKSSAADFHTKFYENNSLIHWSYASGLFYFTKEYHDHVVRVICNPITGQYTILPPDLRYVKIFGYPCGTLVFDPFGKQFKVLVFSERVDDGLIYQILTLGTEKARWREIKCPSSYSGPNGGGICINGALYYFAHDSHDEVYDKIGCFDVRSEKFKLLNLDPDVIGCFCYLINYKGKFCGCTLEYGHDGGFPHELRMWVLDDVEKGEWSTHAYTLTADDKDDEVYYHLFVAGATASGEIVLAKREVHKPFYVFYFNPENNTLQSVEIQVVGEEEEWSRSHSVYCFVDHVEDLNFDVMKTTYAAATSIRRPESTPSREDHQVRTVAHLEQDRCTFESVNKFNALCLLEDD